MTTIRLGATTNIRVVKDGEVIFDGPCSVATVSGETVTLTPATLLPEEPPAWSVVRCRMRIATDTDAKYVPESKWVTSGDGLWTRLAGNAKYAEAREWAAVCDVDEHGTPEVLEPETVKGLRKGYEREHRLSLGFAERAGKAEDKAKAWEGKCDAMELQIKDLTETLESVQERAEEWAAADYEPANDASAATLNTTNRHGREILHLLDVEVVTEEPQEEGARVKDCDGDVWERGMGGQWFRPASPIGFRHPWATVERYRPLTLVESP